MSDEAFQRGLKFLAKGRCVKKNWSRVKQLAEAEVSERERDRIVQNMTDAERQLYRAIGGKARK